MRISPVLTRLAAAMGLVLGVPSGHAATVRMAPIDVPAHGERRVCEYLKIRGGRGVIAGYHLRVQGAVSHHFGVFDASVALRVFPGRHENGEPCAEGAMPALAIGVTPTQRMRLPSGVRLPWRSPQPVVADLHVINPTDRPVRARARVRFTLVRRKPADRLADTWSITNQKIEVPPFGVSTVAAAWRLETPLSVVFVNTHTHNRALELVAERDGQEWLHSTAWDHPMTVLYPQPITLPAGTVVRVACTWDNGVTRPVRLCDGQPCALHEGQSAEDAMCIVGGFGFWEGTPAMVPVPDLP